ncbi:hypothetical protein Ccrd_020076 [Cynara cardunculus var. scolymus]|uniref:Uncharacterized protein n=1 Tax=Cynara cardunculus var. scolymus TaxID=59895 RepID=A0A103Y353_CYNCS|nr:hypothetical protein Ccrd_020076 [Cynara cardunculus var. scolymus]
MSFLRTPGAQEIDRGNDHSTKSNAQGTKGIQSPSYLSTTRQCQSQACFRALQWHRSFLKNKGVANEPSREVQIEAIKRRLGERVHEDPMADLE